MENKDYQASLNVIKRQIPKWSGSMVNVKTGKSGNAFDDLQELVDKEKTPTQEQVCKELGEYFGKEVVYKQEAKCLLSINLL